ncbi:unnamed protein product [Penicillium manginii]
MNGARKRGRFTGFCTDSKDLVIDLTPEGARLTPMHKVPYFKRPCANLSKYLISPQETDFALDDLFEVDDNYQKMIHGRIIISISHTATSSANETEEAISQAVVSTNSISLSDDAVNAATETTITAWTHFRASSQRPNSLTLVQPDQIRSDMPPSWPPSLTGSSQASLSPPSESLSLRPPKSNITILHGFQVLKFGLEKG